MTFYNVEKGPRRMLVMMSKATSHTSGHTQHSLKLLCETDNPLLIPWLLSGMGSDMVLRRFARQLLDAAALVNDDTKPILSKDVPRELYSNSLGVGSHPMRQAWDHLKKTIGRYWSAAAEAEAAFAAFKVARGGKTG